MMSTKYFSKKEKKKMKKEKEEKMKKEKAKNKKKGIKISIENGKEVIWFVLSNTQNNQDRFEVIAGSTSGYTWR